MHMHLKPWVIAVECVWQRLEQRKWKKLPWKLTQEGHHVTILLAQAKYFPTASISNQFFQHLSCMYCLVSCSVLSGRYSCLCRWCIWGFCSWLMIECSGRLIGRLVWCLKWCWCCMRVLEWTFTYSCEFWVLTCPGHCRVSKLTFRI